MRKLYELCFGVEPTEKELALLEIQYQRLLDNGYSDKEAQTLLLNNKLYIDDLLFKDSLILTKNDTVYFHNELQIHSKPGGFDPVTMQVIKQPYYLEMKYRYTMEQLLNYYYDKLLIPIHFRDEKRDSGAFNHLIGYYKFDILNSVDFLLFIIDYIAANNKKVTNPLDLKNWAQVTYEYLELNIICYKPIIKYREELIDNE